MHRVRSALASTMLVLATAPALHAQGGGAPRVDPAEWAPADALVFVGISDVDELRRGIEGTAFYRMMQDPASREMMGQWALMTTFVDEFRKRLAKALDTEPSKLRNPLGGPVAAYVLPKGSDGIEDIHVTLVAGVSDRELMKSYYAALLNRFKVQADAHETMPFASQEIASFTSKAGGRTDEEEHEEEDFSPESLADEEAIARVVNRALDKVFSGDVMPPELSMCLADDRIIVSTSADQVKDLLRSERRDRPLRDAEDYQALGRQFKPLGTVRFLFNLPRFLDLIASRDEDARKVMKVLGTQCLRSVIAHADYGSGDHDGKSELMFLMSGERSGLAKIFSMKNAALEPSRTASADSVFFVGLNVNPLEVLDEVERMVRQTDADAADRMRTGLEEIELEGGRKLNLRKELFENLREPLTFSLAFTRPYGPDSARLLITQAHRDKAAMERLLATFAEMSGGMLVQRELGGNQVFDMVFGGFSVCPTGDQIVLGNTAAVEASLRASTSESLAGDAGYRRAAKFIPGDGWGLCFIDTRKMFEAAIGLMKHREAMESSALANPAAMVCMEIVKAFTGGVKEEKTDELKKLVKYQAPGIVTFATTPDGVRLTSVQLKPEGD